MQQPPSSQPWTPASQSSSAVSDRIRRFGLSRMQSYRRADLEGIPSSLVWSIVNVDPKYCPWAQSSSHQISRSGSSIRLPARSRSFRAFYGALNIIRGDSATASRTPAFHPFRDDSITQAQIGRTPSQSSWTGTLGWRAPFLSGVHGEMAATAADPAAGRGAGTAALTEALTQDGSGAVDHPGLSRSAWLSHQGSAGTDTMQAALSVPRPLPDRGQDHGHAIQLQDLALRTRISEVDGDAVEGVQ